MVGPGKYRGGQSPLRYRFQRFERKACLTWPPPFETTAPVTVFATSWYPFCSQLLADLRKADAPHEVVDVEAPGNEDASAWVESVKNDNRVVPTVLYSDGSHATNPPAGDVLAKLNELN